MKEHNPLYADIEICPECLGLLPVNAILDELFAVTRYSSDTALLASEQAGYVPEDDSEHSSGLEPDSRPAGLWGFLLQRSDILVLTLRQV